MIFLQHQPKTFWYVIISLGLYLHLFSHLLKTNNDFTVKIRAKDNFMRLSPLCSISYLS